MQPIRFQIKTNRVLLARVLPHYNPSTPKIWYASLENLVLDQLMIP